MKTLAALLFSLVIAGQNLFATSLHPHTFVDIIAEYKVAGGMPWPDRPNPDHGIRVYENGAVVAFATTYVFGPSGAQVETYTETTLFELTGAAVTALQANIEEIPADAKLAKVDPNAPECFDIPGATMRVFATSGAIAVSGSYGCQLWSLTDEVAQWKAEPVIELLQAAISLSAITVK